MSNFQIGDIVKLKSGGPDMVIIGIPGKIIYYYTRQWFDVKSRLQRTTFDQKTAPLILVKVECRQNNLGAAD